MVAAAEAPGGTTFTREPVASQLWELEDIERNV